ncbi:hypothetical protein BH09ACT12_BH09ACT12_14570 [soil metagenome]
MLPPTPAIRRRALVLASLVALMVAAIVTVVPVSDAADPPLYGSENIYACTSPGGTSVWHVTANPCGPGRRARALSDFDNQHAFDVYGAEGFSRNFLLWAPEETKTQAEIGHRVFGGCIGKVNPKGHLCTSGVYYEGTVSHLWGDDTTVKWWNGSFISLICGNPGEGGSGKAGPIPTISGTKYEDVNGNHHRDATEPGLSGVTIKIYRDGQYVAQTVTGSDGSYAFRLDAEANHGYTQGTYSLQEVVQAGYQQTAHPLTQFVPYGAGAASYTGFDFGNQKLIDVGIVKDAETPVTIAGESTAWKLTVTNHSIWPAPGTVVTDTLPAGYITITELDPACTSNGLALTCSLGTLAAGAIRVLRFKARTDPGLAKDSTLVNVARVDISPPDTTPGNNTDDATTLIDTRADVSVVKAADRSYYVGGETVTFTLTAHNAGPSVARAVTVADAVPSDFEVVDAVVDAPATCSVSGQQVACSLGGLAPGERRVIIVHGIVRGSAPGAGGANQHSHQLTIDKATSSWDLDPNETANFTVSCPGGSIVSDVSWWVTGVDQGTGTVLDVSALAAGPTSRTDGRVRLHNSATGRAQGHLFAVCVAAATNSVSGHDHRVEVGPDVVSPPTALPVGRHTVTVDVGLNYLAVAPGYEILSGSTRLVASEQTSEGWALTFDTPVAATVRVSARPLHRRLSVAGTPSHSHDLLFTHPVTSVSIPSGESTTSLICPQGSKGITATFDTPYLNGSEPQPVSRVFHFFNPDPAPHDAIVDLLCLGLDVGPVEDPQEFITNTGTVATTTQDPAPGNDADGTTVVVTRALDSAQPFAGNPAAARVSPRFTQTGRTVAGTVMCPVTCRASIVVKLRGHRSLQLTRKVKGGHRTTLKLGLPRHRTARAVVVRIDGQRYRSAVRQR